MSKKVIAFLIALSVMFLFLISLITVNFFNIKNRYKDIEPNLDNYSVAEILILSFERSKTALLRSKDNSLNEYLFRIDVFKSKIKILDNKFRFYQHDEFFKIKSSLKKKESELSVLSVKLMEGKVSQTEVLSYMDEIDSTLLDLQEVIYEIQIKNFNEVTSVIKDNSGKTAVLAIASLLLILLIFFIILRTSYVLKKIIKQKNLFISSIYHELSNSTQAIVIAADIIEHELTCYALQKETKLISYHAKKITEQTKEVMDYSQIEIGNIKINKTYFSINELVNDAIDEMSKNRNNKFYVINLSKNIQILSDKYKVYRIIVNLLDNANKYTKQGIVTINVKFIRKRLFILIKDNGVGFDINKINYLFKAFNQGAEKETKQGLGLGLTIIKNYVEALGGKIIVKSKMGLGSSFFVFIPINVN